MKLEFGLRFEDLYCRDGLVRLDEAFLVELQQVDSGLASALKSARNSPEQLSSKQESELLIAVARYLDQFIAKLFGIEDQVDVLETKHHHLTPLFACKRLFVQRRAAVKIKPEDVQSLDASALENELASYFVKPFSELVFATHVMRWLEDETTHANLLHKALQYAGWALFTDAGRAKHRAGQLFKAPNKWTDMTNLVPRTTELSGDGDESYAVHRLTHLRRRDGFALTDHGADLRGALDQANYCVFCHEQGRDSCSKGMREKVPEEAPITFKKNALGACRTYSAISSPIL